MIDTYNKQLPNATIKMIDNVPEPNSLESFCITTGNFWRAVIRCEKCFVLFVTTTASREIASAPIKMSSSSIVFILLVLLPTR